jgi:hypothetical protein
LRQALYFVALAGNLAVHRDKPQKIRVNLKSLSGSLCVLHCG